MADKKFKEKKTSEEDDNTEIYEHSKSEQVNLMETFRSLQEESEKLARNLETQNTNLNRIITSEKERVSELRNKISDLKDQIDKEHKSNREMSLQYEHMKTGFLAAVAENEGYARDMAAIRKELDAIRLLWKPVDNAKIHITKTLKEIDERGKVEMFKRKSLCYDFEKQEKLFNSNRKSGDLEKVQEGVITNLEDLYRELEDNQTLRDRIDELEEKQKISDKMLQGKYLEAETLQTDLDKTADRVVELETKVTVMSENITKLMETLKIRDREALQLTDLLKDTQTALESEKLAKDQYIIKCTVHEKERAVLEIERCDAADKNSNLIMRLEKEIQELRKRLQEEQLKVTKKVSIIKELLAYEDESRVTELEMEIEILKEKLEEERLRVTEKVSLVKELANQLLAFEVKMQGDQKRAIAREKELENEIKELKDQLKEEKFKMTKNVSLVMELEEHLKTSTNIAPTSSGFLESKNNTERYEMMNNLLENFDDVDGKATSGCEMNQTEIMYHRSNATNNVTKNRLTKTKKPDNNYEEDFEIIIENIKKGIQILTNERSQISLIEKLKQQVEETKSSKNLEKDETGALLEEIEQLESEKQRLKNMIKELKEALVDKDTGIERAIQRCTEYLEPETEKEKEDPDDKESTIFDKIAEKS